MIILPALEVMKAVTDSNITSEASAPRRKSFDAAITLKSLARVEVVLEGKMFARISVRLNDDQKKAFRDTCRIDDTAIGMNDFATVQAMQYIANRDSKLENVLIISENPDQYTQNAKLKVIKPADFLAKYEYGLKPLIDLILPTLTSCNKETRELVITEQVDALLFT